jgi:flagellar biosynthetic protein FlhB
MSEDAGDKTEAPTARRRAEAREQGNIARSTDLTAATILLGMIFMLHFFGDNLIAVLKKLIVEQLSFASLHRVSPVELFQMLTHTVYLGCMALAPLLAGIIFIAILVNICQVGFFLSAQRLQPNIAALNPFRGLSKMFGRKQGGMQLVMTLAKMVLVGLAAYSAVHGKFAQIISVQQIDFKEIFSLGATLIYSITLRIGTILLLLSVTDYFWQRYRIEQMLKMSKQEVKDEMRSMDGDPKIKQRRRQIQLQKALNRLKTAVPKADVVVTNPTEFAVALQYDVATMHAPKVVAKGRGYMALRIRELAIEHGVPILERKPLARALYKMVEVGQFIPEEFYSTVAEILAYVYELTGKIKRPKRQEKVPVAQMIDL